ncbi:MAG TPA: hypothetical protein VFV97_15830 [Rhodanobacteraceae bacterium]|nr:hypothetical protein [Rhodanobacteraceae bacterium]
MMTSKTPMQRIAFALALTVFAPLAQAEVKESSGDAFFLVYEGAVAAPTAKAYADIVQIGKWWDSEHTYSGKSVNLTLKPDAGGCFCERWKDGSVEHGEVLMAMPGKMLRLRTALGPLQERALTGILTFFLKNEDSATTLTVEYRVNGASTSGLDQLAPNVDEVLGAQVDRLRRYIATGSPEPSAEEKAAAAAAATAAQKASDDADIAARVDELKSELQSGTPPPVKANVPTGKPGTTKPTKSSETPTHP